VDGVLGRGRGLVAEGRRQHQICKVMGELGRDYDLRSQ